MYLLIQLYKYKDYIRLLIIIDIISKNIHNLKLKEKSKEKYKWQTLITFVGSNNFVTQLTGFHLMTRTWLET